MVDAGHDRPKLHQAALHLLPIRRWSLKPGHPDVAQSDDEPAADRADRADDGRFAQRHAKKLRIDLDRTQPRDR